MRAVEKQIRRETCHWPPRGWLGLILVAVCWPLNWTLPGVRTSYLFFPLWLGYILVADALVQMRTGSSIWMRSRRDFVLLFLISAPVWWSFELINLRTGNWEYLGPELFDPLQLLLSTISYTVVAPAVFETAELIRNFPWIALVFILEPINHWTARSYFLKELREGDWRTVISLSLGALVCGLFWEMWNYYSFPKWIYHIPGLAFFHVFEMPLLGYGGYVPFALELYALKNFLWPSGPRLDSRR